MKLLIGLATLLCATGVNAQCVNIQLDDRALYDAVTIAAVRGSTPWPDEADALAKSLTSMRKRGFTWTAIYTPTEWFMDDVAYYDKVVVSALVGALTNDARPLPSSESIRVYKMGQDAVKARRISFIQVCR